ncbi:hypothetical protein TNCV_4841501 [Trichonephila clavipes]|uniref:Uncharacterized protein n=1 Tax=Trichonephila clavipes TaxID=2585209 RepID=A0A8X6WIL0_TRICX|nr:hypothetical protein TNCV_4841501 [Trichonephila clavipes]
MDVCKCFVRLRHGRTLNSRRAESPPGRLVEEEERCETLGYHQGILPYKWGGTKPNCTAICMVLETRANGKHTTSLLPR